MRDLVDRMERKQLCMAKRPTLGPI
jgi:hypothetical protein